MAFSSSFRNYIRILLIVINITISSTFEIVTPSINKHLNCMLTKDLRKRTKCGGLEIQSPLGLVTEVIEANKGFFPDLQSSSAAIQSCNELKINFDGLQLFDMMIENKVVLDRISFGLASTCCILDGNADRAIILYKDYDALFGLGKEDKYRREDKALLETTMASCEKCGYWTNILKLYDTFRACHSLSLTERVVNSSLRAAKRLDKWVRFHMIACRIDVLDSNTNDILHTWRDCNTELLAAKSCDDINRHIMKSSGVRRQQSDIEGDLLVATLTKLLFCDIVLNENIPGRAVTQRNIRTLIDDLRYRDDPLVKPTSLLLYGTLIRASGKRGNAMLSFKYFQDAIIIKKLPSDRLLYRLLVEAAIEANDHKLLEVARKLLTLAFGSLKLAETTSSHKTIEGGKELSTPEATFYFDGEKQSVKNGISIHSAATRKLMKLVKSSTPFKSNYNSLPELSKNFKSHKSEELLLYHCEKQALAAITIDSKSLDFADNALADSSKEIKVYQYKNYRVPNVSVNLCMCTDCHDFFKFTSIALNATLSCSDPGNNHVFVNGICSCNGYWGGR